MGGLGGGEDEFYLNAILLAKWWTEAIMVVCLLAYRDSYRYAFGQSVII